MYGYLLLRIKNRRIFVQSGGECCALAKIGRVDRRVWMLGGEVRKDDGTKVRERKRTREQKCERAKVREGKSAEKQVPWNYVQKRDSSKKNISMAYGWGTL